MGYFDDVQRWKNYHSSDYSVLKHLKVVTEGITAGSCDVFVYKPLNIAKRTGEVVRDLTWGEYPTINIETKSNTEESKKAESESILSVLSESKFNQMIAQYIECMATEGGFFIKVRPVYDQDEYNTFKYLALDFYPPELAEPVEWTNNTVTSVNFINHKKIIYAGKEQMATFIENHKLDGTDYYITNTIKVNDETLKPSSINLNIPDQHMTNVDYPLFAYFKSPKTNPESYNIMYGSSIYAGLEPQLEQIDVCYGHMLLDIRDNKTLTVYSREAVPNKDILENEISTERYINPNKSYIALVTKVDGEIIDPVKRLNGTYNTSEIINGLDTALRLYESNVGLSEGTFTSSGEVAKTATEIVSRESATYRTKSMFQQAITDGIKDTIKAIVEGLNSASGTDYRILSVDVKYYDAADQDNSAWITELDSAVNAGLLTWKKAIMEFNSCDEATATQMMNEIIAERKLKEGQVVETGTIKTTEV